VASHPEQGWSLLCNGVVMFEDTGALLPDGRSIPPHRPAHLRVTARLPRPPRPVTACAGSSELTCARSLSASRREPLPPDARDPDIARAKQLARRARRPQRQPLPTQATA